MKKWQVAAVVLVVALLAVVSAGCTAKVAATVNGKAIPQSDVDKQIEIIKKQQPNVFAGANGKTSESNFRQQVLDQLVTAQLVLQEASRLGVTVSDKEVNDKLAQVKKIFNNDDKKLADALQQQGLTVDTYKTKVRDQLISEKMVNNIVKGEKVSDAEVKAYYDKNAAQFVDPDQLRVSQITVKSDAAAKQALDQIKGGADFAGVAKAVSEDTSTKNNGGDLGYRQIDQFSPIDSAALKTLNVGQVSEVIKDESGAFQVFKVEDKKAGRQRTFDESKDEIKQRLVLDKQRAKFLAWIDGLKKKAKIVKNS